MGNYYGGKDQYVYIGDADGSNPVCAGIITGGSHDIEGEIEEMRGVGSSKLYQQRPGLVKPSGSIDIDVQSKDILLKAVRGEHDILPEFSIDAGVYTEGKIHKNCKCSSLSITAAFKSKLTASFSWVGLHVDTGTPQAQSPSDKNVFMWYEGKIVGISDLIREISFKVDHDIDIEAPIREHTPESEKVREGDYLVEGDQKIEVNLKLFTPVGVDISANDLSEISSIQLIFTSGAETLTLTINNLLIKKDSMPLTLDKLVEFGADYTAKDFSIS